MLDLKGKNVLVMGLGVHGGGLGVTKFLLKEGAKITITDLKTEKELEESLLKLKGEPVNYVLGKHREEDFKNTDLVIRNPGVPYDNHFLKIAFENNIPIEMEMGLFFDRCPSKNVIGVTGTKGKTTTTLLISEFLKEGGKVNIIAGNLRISALELLPKIDKETWVVLELSSWQLEGLLPHKVSPHIGALTNIYKDHLNRYKSLRDYEKAKEIIFKFQKKEDLLVVNEENKEAVKISKKAKSKIIYSSSNSATAKRLFEVSRLPGVHNRENVALAWEVASIIGVKEEEAKRALEHFRGVEHHLEFVREIKGVRFYDDSCATNPDATIAALNSFTSPLILIMGGADKNLDFESLAETTEKNVKEVILLEGTATDKIEKSLRNKKPKIGGRFNSLKKAVTQAFLDGESGDTVLLSPACASFGMFINEFDRGEKFKNTVSSITVSQP